MSLFGKPLFVFWFSAQTSVIFRVELKTTPGPEYSSSQTANKNISAVVLTSVCDLTSDLYTEWCVWVGTACSVKWFTAWSPGPRGTTAWTRTARRRSWYPVLCALALYPQVRAYTLAHIPLF
jgi:hypothetical protein